MLGCNKIFPNWFYSLVFFFKSNRKWCAAPKFLSQSTLGTFSEPPRTFVLSNIKCQLWTFPWCLRKILFLHFRISSLIRGKNIFLEPSRTRRVYFINTFEISSWREYFVTFHLLSLFFSFTSYRLSQHLSRAFYVRHVADVVVIIWFSLITDLFMCIKAAQNHAVSANWKCSQCFE